MNRRKLMVVVGTSLIVLLSGCMAMPTSRTSNQGGSNLIQATTKIAQDNVGTLNADDVQVLADLVTDLVGIDIPEVTDEQAAAVISFISANHLSTIANVEDLIRTAQEDPDAVVIPDDVRAVLEAIAADPSVYITAFQSLQGL
jgi:hypothetical protein